MHESPPRRVLLDLVAQPTVACQFVKEIVFQEEKVFFSDAVYRCEVGKVELGRDVLYIFQRDTETQFAAFGSELRGCCLLISKGEKCVDAGPVAVFYGYAYQFERGVGASSDADIGAFEEA